MFRSPGWSYALGFFALLFVGTLAVIGSLVSPRGPVASASKAAPASPDSAGGSPAHATAAAAAPVPGGVLQETVAGPGAFRASPVEASLRPLLEEPRHRAGVFGLDLRTRSFFNVNGESSFAAASLIKIPIVAALLAQVDGGTVRIEETLELKAVQIAGGSGSLQYFPVGSRFTVARLAELMIRKSDNTATNMLIDRLGGMQPLNTLFQAWGLSRTRLNTPLPDMGGTNRTSPRDLVCLLERMVTGGLLRATSRDLLLSWMRRSHVRSLLPAGVSPGTVVANKTGDIPGALGDAGYVEAPGGSRYILAVQVERPRNSARAKTIIRHVSKRVFETITGMRGPARSAHAGTSGITSRRLTQSPRRRTRAS